MAKNNDGTRISLYRQSVEWRPFLENDFNPLHERVEVIGKRLKFVEDNGGGGAVDSVNGLTGVVVLTTTDITEGTRLYFTNTRSRQSVSATSPLAYNVSSGAFSIPQASGSSSGYISSVDWTAFNSKEGAIVAGTTGQYWRGDKSWQDLNTSVVPEGINLYHTTSRVRSSISASMPISFASGVMSMTQAGVSSDGWLSSVDWTTFNSKEGTVAPGTVYQYYRGDKTWQTLDTDAVPEGSNLYHTATRVRDLFSATAPLSYSAGVYSMTQASSTISGWLSSTDWSTFDAKQDSSGNLDSVSSLAGTGIVVRNAADSFVTRSILAGGNIVVTNGDGVAGDVTIALSANPSVTTLTTSSTVTAGGQVIASAGTVSAPSYTFFGDLNTGIYSPVADGISVVSGGSAAIIVNPSSITSGRVHFPVIITGTIAKFGTDASVFILDTPPQIGFNVYNSSGHKFGHTGYGGLIHFDPADGTGSLYFTNNSGTTDAAATVLTRGRFVASRLGIVVSGGDGSVDGFSSKVPATGSAITVERGNIYMRSPVAHGDYSRRLVWQNYNQNTWSLGTIVGSEDVSLNYDVNEMARFGTNSTQFSYPAPLTYSEPTYKFQVMSNGIPGDSLFPAASVRIVANNAGTALTGPDDFDNLPTGGNVIINAGSVVDNGTYYDNGTAAGSVYLNGGYSSYSGDYGRILFGAVDQDQNQISNYGYIGRTISYLAGSMTLGSSLTATAITATTSVSTLHSLRVSNAGSDADPSITSSADTNTGFYWTTTDNIHVTTGGVLRATFSTTAITNTLPIVNPLGSVGAVSYAFVSDTDTGIYSTGSGNISFSSNGTRIMFVSPTSSTSLVTISGTSAVSVGPPYVAGLDLAITQPNQVAPRGILVTTTFTATTLSTTHSVYGVSATAGHAQNASASVGSVRQVFGGHFVANNTGTDLSNATTRNTYGVWAQAAADTNGTSTTYGLYATASGGDTNWGVYSAGGNNYFLGNVSIADTTPPSYSTLHVADSSGPIVSVEENSTNYGYIAQSSTSTILGASGTFAFKAGVSGASGPIASGTTVGTWSTVNFAVNTAQTVSYTTAVVDVAGSSVSSGSYVGSFTANNAVANISDARALRVVYTRAFADTGNSFTYFNTGCTIEYTDAQNSTATSGTCLDIGTGLSVVVYHTGTTTGATMNKRAVGVYSFVVSSGAVISGSSVRETFGVYAWSQGTTDGASTAYGVWALAKDADVNIGVLADATICFAANQLGTALAPAYSFFNDQNTGIYSSGADSLEITTGGVLRLTVDSSGIRATGYRSADNTVGVTGSFPDNNNVTRNFKNGLYVG